MNKQTYPPKLSASIKSAAAQRLARAAGVSLNQWFSVAVAEKIGDVETAAEFLRARAADARPADLLPFMGRAANEPVVPGNAL